MPWLQGSIGFCLRRSLYRSTERSRDTEAVQRHCGGSGVGEVELAACTDGGGGAVHVLGRVLWNAGAAAVPCLC